MGLRLNAIERVVKSESIKRQTNTLLVLIFSWDLLIIKKIYKISPTLSFNTV